MKSALAAVALAAFVAAPSLAQERIVVTGSRIESEMRDYPIPHVGLVRRADFLFRQVTVHCDTRESEQRREELRDTLRDMLRRAENDGDIELSRIVSIDGGDPIVAPFTEAVIDQSFRANYGGRSDTSYVQLLVKTPIVESDALEDATGRIGDFTAGIRGVGRSELILTGEPTLSIVDPQDYRADIVAAMVSDAQSILDALGEGYAARFEGLENQVTWYRVDELDLALFIPHHFEVEAAR